MVKGRTRICASLYSSSENAGVRITAPTPHPLPPPPAKTGWGRGRGFELALVGGGSEPDVRAGPPPSHTAVHSGRYKPGRGGSRVHERNGGGEAARFRQDAGSYSSGIPDRQHDQAVPANRCWIWKKGVGSPPPLIHRDFALVGGGSEWDMRAAPSSGWHRCRFRSIQGGAGGE